MKMHYREDKGYAWHAYPDRCVGCGRCYKACKEDAITITELSGIVAEAY